MVTIKKGNHKLTVSKETYLNMFKELGYELVDISKKEVKDTKDTVKEKEQKSDIKEEKKSEIDDFLDNVCNDDENINKEIDEKISNKEDVSDILSIMSNEKNKKNKK